MAQSSLQINGNFANAVGQVGINFPIQVVNPINQILALALASGLNTINIPSGTTFILVVLPTGNTQSVTLKGVTGDTGIPIQPAQGCVLFTPAPADTTFVLTAGAAITTLTTIYFI